MVRKRGEHMVGKGIKKWRKLRKDKGVHTTITDKKVTEALARDMDTAITPQALDAFLLRIKETLGAEQDEEDL